jgi:2-polyprenyl-3-methyl-5-hydroxy-6-metoxy-1,4-benzoquinol methylase
MGEHDDFWETTSTPRVTGDAYYDRVADSVRRLVVPRMPDGARVLDAGCGDGAYTQVLAPHAAHVDAFDISPPLIARAEQLALSNVSWGLGDVTALPEGTWDVVSCMGVLVCVLDDDDFRSTLAGLAERVAPGGLLVLRETLSGWGSRTVRNEQHTGRYRPRGAYLETLQPAGLAIAAEEHLATWSRLGRRSNHLFVLERRTA